MRRITLVNDAEEELSMSEFRKNPGEIIQAVELGKTFILTKKGKPIATLAPIELNAFQLGAACRAMGRTTRKGGGG